MDLLYGCFGGLVGTAICYPIDTVKTNMQANTKYQFYDEIKKLGYPKYAKSLYKGALSPLSGIMLEKSIIFWTYNQLRQNQMSAWTAGLLSGIATTIIVTPFELVKVRSQIDQKSACQSAKSLYKENGIISFGRGWSATWFREVPGYMIYFTAYDWLNPQIEFKPLVGAFTGSSAWLFIYPSDPIKTVMQSKNIGFSAACNQIYIKNGFRGFYRGFMWGLARSSIFHAGVIGGYEHIKKIGDGY
jgi:hypothetical protein